MTLPSVTIGDHLEKLVKLKLAEGAPVEGLSITLKSSDPKRLLLSKREDQPGSDSIVIVVRQGFIESPEFCMHAFASSGDVEYTAEAAGYTKATGKVTMARSGIMMVGPLRGKKFIITTGGEPARLVFHAVLLDANSKYVEDQMVANEFSPSIEIRSSNEAAGNTVDRRVVIPGGRNSAITFFKASAEGESSISFTPPAPFEATEEYASVVASVRKPGLALSDQVVIGQNLQIGGVLLLGEFAGEKGVDVTITSEDPSKLLLSTSGSTQGSGSITIKVPFGETTARYYLQALGSSGQVDYTATAPGFSKRTAIVGLAPSGVIITPHFQGPPDEAHVLRASAPEEKSKFSVKISQKQFVDLIVWTAELDPITHRCADITVQPLRGGLSLVVPITNSNPGVAKTPGQVTIRGGSEHATATFTPKSAGSTEISVTTPAEFTHSANSTAAIAYVSK